MKDNAIVMASIIVVSLFLWGYSSGVKITGAAVNEPPGNFAFTLNNHISRFYGVDSLVFPRGACFDALQEMYDDIASKDLSTSEGFITHGVDRVATIVFGAHKYTGVLDMATGDYFISSPGLDSHLSLRSEIVFRVPPGRRKRTYLNVDLYGVRNNGLLYVVKGAYRTPTLKCSFLADDEESFCSCDSGVPPEQAFLEFD